MGWSQGSARLVGTLLRLYLDRCLTIIVSVRDFLCYFKNRVLVQVLVSYLFTGLSVCFLVANDPSLRLLIEMDNLGQG